MTSLVIIGEGALAHRCLTTLLARGLRPELTCSLDDSLAALCTEHGLRHVSTRGEVRRWQAERGCDVLLSISNPWVLPAEVIDAVRRRAINFHDGPLPRYAGLHATSWALMHGEREHGICWHEITTGIDEGRLLAKVPVVVEPDDTALTLNRKCFEAAASAFEEVIDAVLSGTEVLVPQQGERSYFGLTARPPAHGLLDFDRPAAALVDLVRALDFGHTPNPLGMPKLWLDDGPCLVGEARIASVASPEAPGTLVACEAGRLRITTRTLDIELCDLAELDGEPLDPTRLQALASTWLGRRLPSLDAESLASLEALDRQLGRGERGWIRRLAEGTAPASHPFVPGGAWAPARSVELPRLNEALRAVAPEVRAARARAIVSALVARLRPEDACDLGIIAPVPEGPLRALMASVVPVRVPTLDAASFEDFENRVGRAWDQIQRAPTLPFDLAPRTPSLRGRPLLPHRWPIALHDGSTPPAGLAPEVALLFAIEPGTGAVRLWATESIDDERVASLDAQLATVAGAAQDDPQHPVATLPLLDARERERLLVTWNDTARPVPEVGLHELFARQACRTPEAPAVRFGEDRLDYAQLDARANQLAHALIERGVEPGDRVGVAVGRSVQMVVALLGVLKAGATYVPLDHHLPRPRVARILERSRPVLVITCSESDQTLASFEPPRLSICDGALADEPQTDPEVPFDRDRVAYVIFTSGSTGEPKAVEVYHRGVVNHALAVQDHYGFSTADRMLCSAPLSFDIAAEQIFPPLLHGAEVVVRPDDLLESFTRFDAFIRAHAITTVALPTAFWHEWVRMLDAGDRDVPPSLRVLGVGTEKVLAEALAVWRARQTRPVRFIQGYGPTEATITCTMYVHDGDDVDPSRPLPIGRPLANTEIYLLDRAGQPVPVGVPGELYVGGRGVARGYLGQPELTAERFLPHPFRGDEGARVYRTGDIARYEPDGQLVFLGRADAQVKIRGYRVELGEIESVIRDDGDVHECVVVLRDDPGQPRRLVAYVLAEPGFDPARLEARCRGQLPEYMVPSAFCRLDTFPVNANGKVDRARLPAPAAPSSRRRDRDASGNAELVVAGAFAETLGLPEVGMSDDFFELGGDSLAAMCLLEQLETLFEMPITLEQFMSDSTVEGVSRLLCQGSRRGAVDRPSVVQLKGGEGPPVFLVLGMYLYQYLARALEGPSPVYAVVLPLEADLLRRQESLPPVEELASLYLEVLRSHTPHGPYTLGGSSFGGVVAYEMARQLEAEGEAVSMVVLLDTVLPGGRAHGLGPWIDTIGRALRPDRRPETLELVRDRLHQLRGRLRSRSDAPPDPRDAERRRLAAWRNEQYERAQQDYERSVRPYGGELVLYRSTSPRRPVLPLHGFERHASGRIHTCDVPGDHMTMLEHGNIDAVAADLQQRLARLSEVPCPQPTPNNEPWSISSMPYSAPAIAS